MSELIPAILVHDAPSFHSRLKLMEGVATTVHLDVMDGAFVPNRTWFDAAVLASLQTPMRFELHLMVADPRRILADIR
ncbi:MAG: ribulose-phosphate 3-epimerase, partial [Patescibacteria group bacterium]